MDFDKLGLPKIPQLDIPTDNSKERDIKEILQLKNPNKFEITEEYIKLGVPLFYSSFGEKGEENIKSIIFNLSPEHSLVRISDILQTNVKGGIYLLGNNKQISQAREDINFILGGKKGIYIEYRPTKRTPSLIYIHNISSEKADEIYNVIIKELIKENMVAGTREEFLPIIEVVDKIFDLAEKINKYKLYKNNKSNIPSDLKDIEKVLSTFENLGNFSFVINLINPLYAVSDSGQKIQLELKIDEIAKAFESTPFTIVITQVDIPDNTNIRPHSWGEEIAEIVLDLPIEDKYKEVIIKTFEQLENQVVKEGFKQYISKNSIYLEEIVKIAGGLYIPDLEEHIIIYSKKHNHFDPKEFKNSFYKYKLEVINKIEALEIITDRIIFDDIGGLEGLKADFYGLLDLILSSKADNVKRTYILTGIPGSGKSFIAKAVANEFEKKSGEKWIGLRFNISALFDMYVGNTEKNFRELVKVIDSLINSVNGRVVLGIDELEKALGDTLGNHEVFERLKGELLTILEDKWGKRIIVIATVNDFEKLPAELISRFANRYFFDIPNEKTREKIIRIKLEKEGWKLSEEEIKMLVESTKGFVGREFDDLFSNIKKKFFTIIRRLIEKDKLKEDEAKVKSPSWKLIKEEIKRMSDTIQEKTQQEKIARYRKLKGKYLDPDEIVVEIDDENINELENLIK